MTEGMRTVSWNDPMIAFCTSLVVKNPTPEDSYLYILSCVGRMSNMNGTISTEKVHIKLPITKVFVSPTVDPKGAVLAALQKANLVEKAAVDMRSIRLLAPDIYKVQGRSHFAALSGTKKRKAVGLHLSTEQRIMVVAEAGLDTYADGYHLQEALIPLAEKLHRKLVVLAAGYTEAEFKQKGRFLYDEVCRRKAMAKGVLADHYAHQEWLTLDDGIE